MIGPSSGTHLIMDNNEIMAKSNATTPSVLYLNNDGSYVQTREIVATNGITAGTGMMVGNEDNTSWRECLVRRIVNGIAGQAIIGVGTSGTHPLWKAILNHNGAEVNSFIMDNTETNFSKQIAAPNARIKTSVSIDTAPQSQPEGLSYSNVSSYAGTVGYAPYLTLKDGSYRVAQLLIDSYGYQAYFRGGRQNEGWSNWRRLYHSGNLTYGPGEPAGGSNGDIYLQHIT